jgi:hypothetical protein
MSVVKLKSFISIVTSYLRHTKTHHKPKKISRVKQTKEITIKELTGVSLPPRKECTSMTWAKKIGISDAAVLCN